MMKFINIGFGNMVSAGRIVAIASPDSAPVKRLVQDAREDGRVIDVSCGRRTRAVIITDSDHVILSAIQTETITNRLSSDDTYDSDPEEEEQILSGSHILYQLIKTGESRRYIRKEYKDDLSYH